MKFILYFIIVIFTASFVNADDSLQVDTTLKLKVVFLTQDVADGYDQAGYTPDFVRKLENYFKKNYPEDYVKYNIPLLLKKNVGPYYIFNKKYSKPIEELLSANAFVMTRLVLEGHDEKGECKGDLFHIKIKVFNSLKDTEEIIFDQKAIPVYKFDEIIEANLNHLIDKILKYE